MKILNLKVYGIYMPQDAFCLKHICNELNLALRQSRVNKINQPLRDLLVFSLYGKDGSAKIELSANPTDARIGISQLERENPLVAPNFCMLLRKHLTGATITDIELVEGERIIKLSFDCKSEFVEAERVLYVEIMGKYSNIILTEKGIILGALKSSSLEEHYKRVMFAGATYTLPEPQQKAKILDNAAVAETLLRFNGGDIATFVFENVCSLAYSTACQLSKKYFGGTDAEKFDSDSAEKFSLFLQKEFLNEQTVASVSFVDGQPKDFFPFECFGEHKKFDTVCQAQDFFYTQKEGKKIFLDAQRKLHSIVKNYEKKLEKKLTLLLDRKQECSNIEINKIKGELITSNIYALKKGLTEVELINYYDEDAKPMKISLDLNLTPAQNAQKYFKKYNKQKRTLVAIEPQISNLLEDIAYTKSIVGMIDKAEDTNDLFDINEELIALGLIKLQTKKKGKTKDIPFRQFELCGFKVFAGRNNIQNDKLLKFASESDIWLHTQKYHSSHLIICINDKPLPQEVLLKACEICASLSDGKTGDKIPVDYCERKYVKKPSKAKAGFVIYTNYKTVLVTPNRHNELEVN